MKLPKKVKNKPYGTQNGRALLRKWKFAALDQILSAQKINASRQTAVACIKRPRVSICVKPRRHYYLMMNWLISAPPEDKTGPWKARLEQLLPQLPMPCPELRVIRGVGEGTFSTVFLVRKIQTPLSKPGKVEQYAIKHLVPTACPDRVLTEVECLRMAGGESNVLPLIFAHR